MRTPPKIIMGTIALSIAIALGGGVAGAQVDTYEETPPQVIDDGATPGQVDGDEMVAGEAAADVRGSVVQNARTSSTLPVTGGDLAGLTVLGAGAVATGAALVLHRRRAEA